MAVAFPTAGEALTYAELVLVQSGLLAERGLELSSAAAVELDGLGAGAGDASYEPPPDLTPDHLAYVLYTSQE